jgi:DNA modification methylase
MKPYYEKNGIVIYHGDCREVLPLIPAWDCLITSPPYGQQREYTIGAIDWNSLVPPALATAPVGDRQVFVNLGLIHKDGEVIEYWSALNQAMRRAGWRLFGWYVWDKQDGMAGNWNGRLAPAHEWVFHYNVESRQPHKVVRTKGAGQLAYKGNTGLRRADGSMSGWCHVGQPTQEFKIADSVIRLQPQKDRSDSSIAAHPAVYPVSLPLLLIDSYTRAGETVLDPFLGSGTTLVAAKALGRKAIGIELEERYCEIAATRLAQDILDFGEAA